MQPYLFKIGFFEVRIYALMYIISLFIAIYLAKKDEIALSRGVKKELIEDFAYYVIISGLIGARIYYVLLRWEIYKDNIFDVFKVWQGGLAIHGGIIGGMIGIYIYSKIKKINFFVLTDMSVGPLMLGQALGRIGNFTNGEIHGFPTITPLSVILKGNFSSWWQYYQSLPLTEQLKYKKLVPWGIKFPLNSPAGSEFPNIALHPAMLYEMILNLIAFYFIYHIFRKKRYNIGVLSFIYLILYGIIRIIVSTFRVEDLYIYNIKAPYLISLIMIIIGIFFITYLNKKNKSTKI